MTTLVLSQISFEARHGHTAAERRTSRRFEVTVELDAPVEEAGRSDRLADTVDYSTAAEVVVTIGTGGPHHLLETVARSMVDALMARFPAVTGVRLELRKLAPPACAGNPLFAAVRLTEARAARLR